MRTPSDGLPTSPMRCRCLPVNLPKLQNTVNYFVIKFELTRELKSVSYSCSYLPSEQIDGNEAGGAGAASASASKAFAHTLIKLLYNTAPRQIISV